MRHHCSLCHAATDFIHAGTLHCPECSEPEQLTQSGSWYHVQTSDGALADGKARRMALDAMKKR